MCRWISWADPEGAGGPDAHPRLENQVALGFLINTGTDPPSRSNWTPRVQLLLEGGSFDPL